MAGFSKLQNYKGVTTKLFQVLLALHISFSKEKSSSVLDETYLEVDRSCLHTHPYNIIDLMDNNYPQNTLFYLADKSWYYVMDIFLKYQDNLLQNA